jgi:hypothetical protein
MHDIVSGLTSVLSIASKIRDINERLKDAELKGMVVGLMEELTDLKLAMINLKEENIQLREDLVAERSKTKVPTKDEMTLKGDMYYIVDDGPYCTACWDTGRRKVRVPPMAKTFHAIAKFRCNVCKAQYQG